MTPNINMGKEELCTFLTQIQKDINHERELRESWERAHEELDDQRHSAGDKALAISSVDMSRRLNEMNQFREQLNQERAEYVLRREHDLLADRLKILEIARGEQTGKAAAYASIAAFIGTGAAVILHFWR